MLFNSIEFIFFYLPITLGIYYWFAKRSEYQYAIVWLVVCSLFFYAWWNPAYLGLMFVSMLVNYGVGLELAATRSKRMLTFGVVFNLLLLGYYKYTDFFIANTNALLDTNFSLHHIILPLGISFFTFTQTAYLVDVYRGIASERNLAKYLLFVTYFPHLIAGPILHHKEMMPQFSSQIAEQINARNFAAGIAFFSIGLFKKVMLADDIVQFANPVFTAADAGQAITFLEGWMGALAYTLQLYFDFSGYADMAIGASLMLGIRLPLNFNSPYKSTSIIEFWRRWHMTLSRFLRDYLYISLGGNRKGEFRRYINLFLTMLLGGIWHGAGWTFVAWGALHGTYLAINHLWRSFVVKLPRVLQPQGGWFSTVGFGLITFVCVVFAWVFFRADTLDGAVEISRGMLGLNGVVVPEKYLERWGEKALWLQGHGVLFQDNLVESMKAFTEIFKLLLFVWLLPNTQTLLRNYNPVTEQVTQTSRLEFRPTVLWLALIVTIFFVSALNLTSVSEFLYFRF